MLGSVMMAGPNVARGRSISVDAPLLDSGGNVAGIWFGTGGISAPASVAGRISRFSGSACSTFWKFPGMAKPVVLVPNPVLTLLVALTPAVPQVPVVQPAVPQALAPKPSWVPDRSPQGKTLAVGLFK